MIITYHFDFHKSYEILQNLHFISNQPGLILGSLTPKNAIYYAIYGFKIAKGT